MTERLYRCRFCQFGSFVVYADDRMDGMTVECECGATMLPVFPAERDAFEKATQEKI